MAGHECGALNGAQKGEWYKLDGVNLKAMFHSKQFNILVTKYFVF